MENKEGETDTVFVEGNKVFQELGMKKIQEMVREAVFREFLKTEPVGNSYSNFTEKTTFGGVQHYYTENFELWINSRGVQKYFLKKSELDFSYINSYKVLKNILIKVRAEIKFKLENENEKKEMLELEKLLNE